MAFDRVPRSHSEHSTQQHPRFQGSRVAPHSKGNTTAIRVRDKFRILGVSDKLCTTPSPDIETQLHSMGRVRTNQQTSKHCGVDMTCAMVEMALKNSCLTIRLELRWNFMVSDTTGLAHKFSRFLVALGIRSVG